MNYRIGDVVKSISGHDKGVFYVVTKASEKFVFVANGKTRAIDSPKRKNIKHVQYVGRLSDETSIMLEQGTGPFFAESGTGDSELRKMIKALKIT